MWISVSAGRALLLKHGLMQMPGSNNSYFEVWISANGYPETVPYKDRSQQEFLEAAGNDIVTKYPIAAPP